MHSIYLSFFDDLYTMMRLCLSYKYQKKISAEMYVTLTIEGCWIYRKHRWTCLADKK